MPGRPLTPVSGVRLQGPQSGPRILAHQVYADPSVISVAGSPVVYDASTFSGSTSFTTTPDPFTFDHTPAGTPRGVLVFTVVTADVDAFQGVSYGGVALTAVASAADTAGEPGRVQAWFLGAGIPTGLQTVSVDHNADVNEKWVVVVTVTATADTEVVGTPVLLQESQSLVEQPVDSGTAAALRFAGVFSGLASTPGGGVSSTNVLGIDFGALVAQVVRETTGGTRARPVGFDAGTADDVAAVHVAIAEAVTSGVTVTVDTPGSLTVTGQPALLTNTVVVEPGALTVTGQPASFTQTQNLTAGSVTIAGQSAAFTNTERPTAGSLTVTGAAVTAGTVTPVSTAGALSVTGQAAALTNTERPTSGALTITGQTVTTAVATVVPVDTAGALTIAGQSATFTNTERPAAGLATITGQALTLTTSVPVSASTLTITGQTQSFTGTERPTAGTITITGQVVTAVAGTIVTVDGGALSVAGQSVTFTQTQAVAAGLVSVQGQVVAATTGAYVTVDTVGALSIAGQAVAFTTLQTLEPGFITITGQTADLSSTATETPSPGGRWPKDIHFIDKWQPKFTLVLVDGGSIGIRGQAIVIDIDPGVRQKMEEDWLLLSLPFP